MDKNFIPAFACRFKVREDLSCYIGFFGTRGVLVFNDIGAFIVKQIDGQNSIQTIGEILGQKFPAVEDPIKETEIIIQQLQAAGLM